jgi:hypothetical protein
MLSNSIGSLRQMQRYRVLCIYRKIHKAGITWNNKEDRDYIINEARQLFRDNQQIEDPDTIEKKIEEAQARYDLAIHYKIPYPRACHTAPRMTEDVPVGLPQYIHSLGSERPFINSSKDREEF